MQEPTPHHVDVAHLFARASLSPAFIFWLADDWLQPFAAQLRRSDPEHVVIAVRGLSRGGTIGLA